MLKVNPQPLTFIVALKLMLKFKLTNSKLKQTAFKRNNTNDLINQTKKNNIKDCRYSCFKGWKMSAIQYFIPSAIPLTKLWCLCCALDNFMSNSAGKSIQFKIICGGSIHQFGRSAAAGGGQMQWKGKIVESAQTLCCCNNFPKMYNNNWFFK